jgi:hypothetical protein
MCKAHPLAHGLQQTWWFPFRIHNPLLYKSNRLGVEKVASD